MLSEINQRKKYWICGVQKSEFTETESRLVVASDKGVGEMGEGSQRIQTSSYKMNKFWRANVQHDDYT